MGNRENSMEYTGAGRLNSIDNDIRNIVNKLQQTKYIYILLLFNKEQNIFDVGDAITIVSNIEDEDIKIEIETKTDENINIDSYQYQIYTK